MVADDGYRPDMILAIARGGLFCAGSLGYALFGEERLRDELRVLHRAWASAWRCLWCCRLSLTSSTTAGRGS